MAGWTDNLVSAGLIVGVLTIGFFAWYETKVEAPLVPREIIRDKFVVGANLVTLLLYFALSGMIFLLVLNLQQVQDYTPVQAGLALLPPMILITFLSGPAGAWADKHGPRNQMIVGPLLVAVAIALLIIPGIETNFIIHFLPSLILFGLGMAIVIAPLTKSAMSVPEKYSGLASGINNAMSRIASLLAVAILGSMLVSFFSGHITKNIESTGLPKAEQTYLLEHTYEIGGLSLPEASSDISKARADELVKQSFVRGFRWSMALATLLVLMSVLIAYKTICQQRK